MVRQLGAYVYSIKLYYVGNGETEHPARQHRENVFGYCQLRFHCGVRARDVCQSKIYFFLIRIYQLFLSPFPLPFFSTTTDDKPITLIVSNTALLFLYTRCVQVVAAGMFYGIEPYFKSGWNIMDGLLVIVSIIDLLMSLISESSPKIFGILRVSTCAFHQLPSYHV